MLHQTLPVDMLTTDSDNVPWTRLWDNVRVGIHCAIWPSPLWKRWVCHWRWGCTLGADWGPEIPLPVPPQWNAALKDRKKKLFSWHIFPGCWNCYTNVPSPTTLYASIHTRTLLKMSQIVVRTLRSLPANAWAWSRSCVHVCRSAKALMPKQLVGWSWDCRNSQQTWRTSISWRRLAAGSRTWTYDRNTQT